MIKLVNVSKKLDDVLILNNVNLKLKKGYIYGLIGRNGSGKTMLLNTICGFVKPSTGEVLYNDINLYEKRNFLPNARALIENPKFIDSLSGYQNLELLAGINNTIGKEQIELTLKEVDLFEDKDKKFSKYSLGMKQKLEIAQVLMENPEIMIFDEPFNGLDQRSAKKIRKKLQSIKKDKIIIIATHIREDVEELCDYVYTMDAGNLLYK